MTQLGVQVAGGDGVKMSRSGVPHFAPPLGVHLLPLEPGSGCSVSSHAPEQLAVRRLVLPKLGSLLAAACSAAPGFQAMQRLFSKATTAVAGAHYRQLAVSQQEAGCAPSIRLLFPCMSCRYTTAAGYSGRQDSDSRTKKALTGL